MQQPTHKQSLFLAKGFYFVYFAAMAALMPFLVLYYEQLGLSGSKIGVLVSIPPFSSIFAASFWGGIADASKRHQLIQKATIIGAMACALLILQAATYLWLLLIVIFFAIFVSPIVPIADNTTLSLLNERRDQYGKLRLWGAVGWGLAAPLIGRLVEQRGLAFSFYGYVLFLGIGLLITFALPVAPTPMGQSYWHSLTLFFKNRSWLLFLLMVFIWGVSQSFVNNYLFLYMKTLNASETLMGFALTMGTISELVIFFFADKLLQRWGNQKVVMITLLALAIRMLAYSFIKTPGLVLIVQLLHGLTFAAMLSAGVAYANKLAPSGLGATAQGIFYSVAFGLGPACGGYVGGLIYEHYGPFLVYRWAGLVLLGGLLIFAGMTFRAEKQKSASKI
jgi:oligosaccharide:H+ symporter